MKEIFAREEGSEVFSVLNTMYSATPEGVEAAKIQLADRVSYPGRGLAGAWSAVVGQSKWLKYDGQLIKFGGICNNGIWFWVISSSVDGYGTVIDPKEVEDLYLLKSLVDLLPTPDKYLGNRYQYSNWLNYYVLEASKKWELLELVDGPVA